MPVKPVKRGYEIRITPADYDNFYGGVDHMDTLRALWQQMQPEDMIR
jgi:hypothetical protein